MPETEKLTLADIESFLPKMLLAAAFAAKFTKTPKDDAVVAFIQEAYENGSLLRVLGELGVK